MDRVTQIDTRLLAIERDQAAHPEAYLVLAQERLILTQERATLTTTQGKYIIPIVLFNCVVTFWLFVSYSRFQLFWGVAVGISITFKVNVQHFLFCLMFVYCFTLLFLWCTALATWKRGNRCCYR